MNILTNVVVAAISSKPVTTKFGTKNTYSFNADGMWFKTGFKNHNLNVGDVVSFPFTEGKYGKEVEPSQIEAGAPGSAPAEAAPATTSAAPTKTYSNSGKGVFPIPPLDGQRSIVRQNALTNARELIVGVSAFARMRSEDPAVEQRQLEEVAAIIINLARKFEAYTAGDIDAQEVAAEEAEKAAA